MTLRFSISKEDSELVTKIVKRAASMQEGIDLLSITMDLTACHANGCPMDFQRLLDADNFNFSHDVFGINRHINRRTGKLSNCFLPRFSKPTGD